MTIDIRPATLADIPALLELIRELALYEKAPEAVTVTEASMREAFSNGRYAAMVATQGQEVVGMVLYYDAYSTWKGSYIYLDDFVVKEEYRGKGIGAKLFDALIYIARKQGAAFLKWQVLKWNDPAIRFYRKYDIVVDDEWLDMKIFFYASK